jgi:hypothetical protein
VEVSSRAVHPLLIPALLVAAICGYLLGHHHSSVPPPSAASGDLARVTSSAGALEYPPSWQPSLAAVSIPGLALSHATMLAARGGHEGLISGLLPAGEDAPLPSALLERLRATPRAEVLDLITTQAFRYRGLSPSGYQGRLDIYVIPQATGPARALVCYSATAGSSPSAECQQIVSGVTLIGSSAPSLDPEPVYAGKLAGILSSLETERSRDRARMSSSSSPAEVGQSASALASRFASAGSAVQALEAPVPAVAAQAALQKALSRAGAAYAALAQAASTESLYEYESDRATIGTAETAVDAALESFSLLGYAASG